MMNLKIPAHAWLLGLAGLVMLAVGVFYLATPKIVVSWSTATEFQTAGYRIYRSTAFDGTYELLTETMIPAEGDGLTGAEYEYVDRTVSAGVTYYYQLEEVELSGSINLEGPIEATADRRGLAESLLGAALLALSVIAARLSRSRPPIG